MTTKKIEYPQLMFLIPLIYYLFNSNFNPAISTTTTFLLLLRQNLYIFCTPVEWLFWCSPKWSKMDHNKWP